MNAKTYSPKFVALATLAAAALAGGILMATSDPAVSQSPNAASGAAASAASAPASQDDANLEQATFGSGCFWCTEAFFSELKGVKSAVSGYSGGRLENPTYEQVCTGATGHAEVVHVTFDPKVISFAELLEVFWQTHDPTTLNRQGADTGTQYRSAVFYHNDQQKREAEFYKKKLNESGAFKSPIVTEITKFDKFYPAEDYHQEYYATNPEQSYCRAIIRPKMEKFRKAFADKLKGAEPSNDGEAASASGGATTSAPDAPAADPEKIDWSKVDWKKRLSPEQFAILRHADTERAFTGEYWDFFEKGAYKCRGCGLPLFESDAKFDAHCGWPSFDRAINDQAVVEVEDNSHGMRRIEVRCRRCGGHLGHVFDDGPTDTGLRYCMNSASIKFVPSAEEDKKAEDKPKASANP
jgi:methionine-S-sulfoxide reductase/methionine-R-sulfoxide reductase